MKVGFTPDEASKLYYGLAGDVWTDLDLSIPVPPIEFGKFHPLFMDSYAATEFGSDPDMRVRSPRYSHALACTQFPSPIAHEIAFNLPYLPFFYEDELIGCILHEFAHAIVGAAEGHGSVWSDTARSIGGHYDEFLELRLMHEAVASIGGRVTKPFVPWYEVHA